MGELGKRWIWSKTIVRNSQRTNKKENIRSSKNIGAEISYKTITLENIILCERTWHNSQVMNNFIYTNCPERMGPWTKKEIGGCHGLRKWEWGTLMIVTDSLLSGWHMHSGFRKCWLYNFVSVLNDIEIILSSKVIDFIEG